MGAQWACLLKAYLQCVLKPIIYSIVFFTLTPLSTCYGIHHWTLDLEPRYCAEILASDGAKYPRRTVTSNFVLWHIYINIMCTV